MQSPHDHRSSRLCRRDWFVNNTFRVVGAVGTYLIGLALGTALLWTGVRMALDQATIA